MKLKKWVATTVLGVLMCAVLTGCTSSVPIPDSMDEQELLNAGQQVLDLVVEDRFDEVHALLREDIVQQLEVTTEKIKQQMDVDEQEYGKLKKVKETWTSGVAEDKEANIEEHAIAWFECQYQEDRLVYGFAFDLDLELIGMSVNRE